MTHSSIHVAAPSPNPLPQGERASLASPVTRHPSPVTATARAHKIEPVILAEIHSFSDTVKLFEQRREPILAAHLINDMRLVAFEQGSIEVHPIAHMNADIAARINRRLAEWTGEKWNLIFNTNAQGDTTLREQRTAALKQQRDYAIAHPKIQAVLEVFPDATVIDFVPNKS